MSTSEIASILDNSKELDRLRKEQEEVLSDINKLHKKLQTNPEVVEKPGDTSLSKLKHLYTQAKELAETEVRRADYMAKPYRVSNVLLTQLDALLPPGPPGQQRRRVEGNEQKKKQKKNDSDIPRVSPSMRNQLDNFASLKGEQVAARVTTDETEKDEYIVVKVMHYDRETRENGNELGDEVKAKGLYPQYSPLGGGKVLNRVLNNSLHLFHHILILRISNLRFEVLDEEPGDDEEGGGQRKYKLPASHIIPFPKRNDPSTALDFPPGRAVLAVYPGTTALYKATVVNPNRKRKTDDYLLEFDDDESEDGSMPKRTVPFHNVVALPEGHRQ
uniref:SGF29 C-terminal domain-containing protein n=1 Tax=Chenopodium quinoa TaxID=63459 RepID=A0A803MPK3_CHEQI